MGRKTRKTLAVTVLALAGLTVLAPAGSARVAPPEADAAANADAILGEIGLLRPDDRAVRVTVMPGADSVVRPDDRAVRVTPLTPQAIAVRPDHRPEVRGPGLAPEAVSAPALGAPDGVDYGDAAIGAGIAIALALLLTAMLQAIRARRQVAH